MCRDAPLWSAEFEINSARVFQLRHPSVESNGLVVGDFDLTEVSVTVKNGVKLIRFLNPDVPDYRLVNLSTVPLAISQFKNDGPFEVLKPTSLGMTHQNDEEENEGLDHRKSEILMLINGSDSTD